MSVESESRRTARKGNKTKTQMRLTEIMRSTSTNVESAYNFLTFPYGEAMQDRKVVHLLLCHLFVDIFSVPR